MFGSQLIRKASSGASKSSPLQVRSRKSTTDTGGSTPGTPALPKPPTGPPPPPIPPPPSAPPPPEDTPPSPPPPEQPPPPENPPGATEVLSGRGRGRGVPLSDAGKASGGRGRGSPQTSPKSRVAPMPAQADSADAPPAQGGRGRGRASPTLPKGSPPAPPTAPPPPDADAQVVPPPPPAPPAEDPPAAPAPSTPPQPPPKPHPDRFDSPTRALAKEFVRALVGKEALPPSPPPAPAAAPEAQEETSPAEPLPQPPAPEPLGGSSVHSDVLYYGIEVPGGELFSHPVVKDVLARSFGKEFNAKNIEAKEKKMLHVTVAYVGRNVVGNEDKIQTWNAVREKLGTKYEMELESLVVHSDQIATVRVNVTDTELAKLIGNEHPHITLHTVGAHRPAHSNHVLAHSHQFTGRILNPMMAPDTPHADATRCPAAVFDLWGKKVSGKLESVLG